jgi:hypothetical protein
MREIRLTKRQVSAARWALGGIEDLDDDGMRELGYSEEDVPEISGGRLIFGASPGAAEVAGDVVYRVGVQLTDIMADQTQGDVKNLAGRNLAAKIRAAFPEVQITEFGETLPTATHGQSEEVTR